MPPICHPFKFLIIIDLCVMVAMWQQKTKILGRRTRLVYIICVARKANELIAQGDALGFCMVGENSLVTITQGVALG